MKKILYSICIVAMAFGCGEDGEDGLPGMSGFNSLLVVTELPVGDDNCPNGGTRIDTGIDNGDNQGTAGNETLEAGEIDNTAFICNGENGTNGSDGGSLREFSLANFGSDPYAGFEAVSISDRYPTTRIEDQIELGVFVDKAEDPDSTSRVRTLIRFNGIQDQIEALHEFGVSSVINGATLYLHVFAAPFDVSFFNSDIPFIEFGAFTHTGEEWVQSEVSWNEMKAGEPWEIPGLYQQAFVNNWEDKEFIANTASNSNQGTGDGRGWYAFRLDTARMGSWRQDNFEDINKGILLTIGENFAIDQGSNVNTEMEIDNVLIHFEIEIETPAGGRIGGSQGKAVPWNERTHAEQFTPLERYLNSQ